MHETIEWHCIGDSSEDEGSTAVAKRVRRGYADKDDGCEDKAADLATSFVTGSVNSDGMDEVESGPSTCMPGIITKSNRYRVTSTGAAGRLHGRCDL